VVENSARVRRARSVASITIGLTLLYAAPALSWWLLPLFGLSILNTETLDRRMRRSRRPEYHAAFSILLSQCMLAAGGALTGGPLSPILPLIAVPTAFAATRFRAQVASVAAGAAILLLLAATLAVDPAETAAHPAALIVAVVVVVGVSAAAEALNGAEVQHRNEATLDPLTGLLNRQGLEHRFRELADQARATGAPISVLVCDLDHFKQVNDSHGHRVGDAILRQIADEMRTQLRSFELIYRIGGEEFLIVLPGAELTEARMLGERLCEAVRRCRAEDVATTMSVGVSTRSGAEAQFVPLFEAADNALYEAKAAGRDRVCVATVPSSIDGPARIRLVSRHAQPAGGSDTEATVPAAVDHP
jgi:diguanylate cyclase (GGDEF)-like protein